MIYLDNAATTIHKPAQVVSAVAEALCSAGNSGRGVHGASLDASRIVFETRALAAELFGAPDPSCIAFTKNSTEALNIALQGLLQPGDHVITTAAEHNSVLRPLYLLEKQGVELTILPCDEKGNFDVQGFEREIRRNTRLLVCTHGSNLTGNLTDIQAVGEIAEKKGVLLVVDASQTAGVFPLHVQEMHIDVLCFTGHKGLLGPQGTGGLVVRPGLAIRPLMSGGSGVQTYLKEHPREMPTALEAGTLNIHGLAGLRAALSWLKEQGLDSLRERELEMMWEFYRRVSDISGVRVYGDFSKNERCPIVTLNIRDYDSSRVADVLAEEYGIAVRPGAHCAPLMHQALGTVEQGAVRFSFSHGNTLEEIKKAAEAVREIAE
ncbi:MAG: aminotransferase class V-fold PLP-dependent enzyme [Lachnospiraceae bacterium]|nr:aminotransferase class V-fold PLP-dependent enzyme [Lachnospiraceae bacterium]